MPTSMGAGIHSIPWAIITAMLCLSPLPSQCMHALHNYATPRGSAAVKDPTPFGVATLPYRCVGVPSAASSSFGLAV